MELHIYDSLRFLKPSLFNLFSLSPHQSREENDSEANDVFP